MVGPYNFRCFLKEDGNCDHQLYNNSTIKTILTTLHINENNNIQMHSVKI